MKCTEEQLVDALMGNSQPIHREMLALQLERLHLIDTQIAKLNQLIAQAMKLGARLSVFLSLTRQAGAPLFRALGFRERV